MVRILLARYWFSALLALGAYVYLTHLRDWQSLRWNLLDWVDLAMHEAGHVVFGFFGEFLQYLGGTLMQVLIPLLIAFYFAQGRGRAGTQFGLFWLGESLLDVSIYAGDARALQLQLIGGDHDWNYLLARLGLLAHDQAVAACFVGLAVLAFGAAVVWPSISTKLFHVPDLGVPV